jgi:type VI secretion system protein ImpC
MKRSKPISSGKVEVNIIAEEEEREPIPEPEVPFRIVLLGDFSGRANRGLFEKGADFTRRRLVQIDRDNFDEVMAKLGVEIHLPVAGETHPPVQVRFNQLDDFHPDRLFERMNVFRSLNEMTQGLDPSLLSTKTETGKDRPKEPFKPNLSELTKGSLIDRMIEETETKPKPSEWDAFLQRIVEPHLVPDIEAQKAKLEASVNAISSKLMAAILHYPDFQCLEAAWRGAYFLISRLETDNGVQIYLVDLSQAELAGDLMGAKNLRSTGISKLLIHKSSEILGEKPWAVLAGIFIFDHTAEDAELLSRLGMIASELKAPFISSASPHLLGCESLAEKPDPDHWKGKIEKKAKQAWMALRKNRESSYLGLALPRFLLRLPYGPETDPIESFDFEEMPAEPKHEQYLWGNPTIVCVYLLAQAFIHFGWCFRPGAVQEIESLPLHIYKKEEETRVKPCGEVVLTERAVEMILEKGMMPLISFQNRDILRLARFQSLSDPPTPLAGRWS